ncbi:unnamed protein product [Trichogramma brassicae]|uniref:Uncharacterized protein n=1 Tax=Trichogramma brassicae TaxID=86971 RepID=A0A6H5IEG6_9HYME|nr:unnamed protein product [Trichogramma brassicae]
MKVCSPRELAPALLYMLLLPAAATSLRELATCFGSPDDTIDASLERVKERGGTLVIEFDGGPNGRHLQPSNDPPVPNDDAREPKGNENENEHSNQNQLPSPRKKSRASIPKVPCTVREVDSSSSSSSGGSNPDSPESISLVLEVDSNCPSSSNPTNSSDPASGDDSKSIDGSNTVSEDDSKSIDGSNPVSEDDSNSNNGSKSPVSEDDSNSNNGSISPVSGSNSNSSRPVVPSTPRKKWLIIYLRPRKIIDELLENDYSDEEIIEKSSDASSTSGNEDSSSNEDDSDVEMEDVSLNQRLNESRARGRPITKLKGKNGFCWDNTFSSRRSAPAQQQREKSYAALSPRAVSCSIPDVGAYIAINPLLFLSSGMRNSVVSRPYDGSRIVCSLRRNKCLSFLRRVSQSRHHHHHRYQLTRSDCFNKQLICLVNNSG